MHGVVDPAVIHAFRPLRKEADDDMALPGRGLSEEENGALSGLLPKREKEGVPLPPGLRQDVRETDEIYALWSRIKTGLKLGVHRMAQGEADVCVHTIHFNEVRHLSPVFYFQSPCFRPLGCPLGWFRLVFGRRPRTSITSTINGRCTSFLS